MDRGYIDFKRLYVLHQKGVFFVVRAKDNLKYRRLYSSKADKTGGLRADQTIDLTTKKSREGYPEHLRRISYVDKEQNKRFVFLTNHFGLPAQTVADIYKQRWQVELFFKWIKQHLRIVLTGLPNAVKSQIWVTFYILAGCYCEKHPKCSLYTFYRL
jgi:hypothetical protein